MRRVRSILIFAIAAACTDVAAPSESPMIATGTSFGMCIGYCITELAIDSGRVQLTETSRDSARFPPRRRSRALEPDEWNRLRSLADPQAMQAVAGVHGCPDCADGGAEWIELRTNDTQPRATFEYGKPPASIRALHAELRALRATFPEL